MAKIDREPRALKRFRESPRPFRVEPRIQAYAWGSPSAESRILRFLSRDPSEPGLPERIAELWFGAHPKNPGRVCLGRASIDLRAFAEVAGECLLGPGRAGLGQLFKILDAREPLSLQLHARAKPDSKNECWIVPIDIPRLEAGMGDATIADITLGFRLIEEIDEESLPMFKAAYKAQPTAAAAEAFHVQRYRQALNRGQTDPAGTEIMAFHNRIEVRRQNGEAEILINGKKMSSEEKGRLGLPQNPLVVNIPGGTPHALSGGVIFELQETGDRTLRLYDRGRNDPARPLHVEEAVSVLDFTPRAAADYLVAPIAVGPWTTNLIRTPHFAMDLVNMPRCADVEGRREEVGMSGSCQMLIVAEGAGRLIFRPRGAKRNRALEIRKAETLIVPAALGGYRIEGGSSGLAVFKAYEPSPEEITAARECRGLRHFWDEEGFF
ncbi:MAG: type I phosphomannose isomerase catalytic subunit [Acidobacteriota bacterium]|nr:type I phosphomannose isomerase catalytic subunit [Acidobacteriota bacterium]